MVISNKAEFPGIIIKGKETPHPDRRRPACCSSMTKATENGGLIFGGSKDKQGKITSYGHLSFDQYEQDQVFTIDAGEERRQAHLGACAFSISRTTRSRKILTRPRASASYRKISKQAAWKAYSATTPHS